VRVELPLVMMIIGVQLEEEEEVRSILVVRGIGVDGCENTVYCDNKSLMMLLIMLMIVIEMMMIW
jgi:hypothetical protein